MKSNKTRIKICILLLKYFFIRVLLKLILKLPEFVRKGGACSEHRRTSGPFRGLYRQFYSSPWKRNDIWADCFPVYCSQSNQVYIIRFIRITGSYDFHIPELIATLLLIFHTLDMINQSIINQSIFKSELNSLFLVKSRWIIPIQIKKLSDYDDSSPKVPPPHRCNSVRSKTVRYLICINLSVAGYAEDCLSGVVEGREVEKHRVLTKIKNY